MNGEILRESNIKSYHKNSMNLKNVPAGHIHADVFHIFGISHVQVLVQVKSIDELH